ncbi:AMP-binding protein, partial [Cloacibacillus evryensis]|uniref:AMP-binding protein n=1 Tax=Cloacibacillus evryensis TaxID=508460 RepID=UPI0021089EB1
IKHAEVTIATAVPTMIALMIGAVSRGATLSSSMRCILSGGDRLPARISARAERLLGVPVLQGYGLTEASSVVALPPSINAAKPGSVGTLLSCVESEIRSDEGA